MNISSHSCQFCSNMPMSLSHGKCYSHPTDHTQHYDHCPLRDCPMFMKSNCPLRCVLETHQPTCGHFQSQMHSHDPWKSMLGMSGHHGMYSHHDHCPLRDCPVFMKSACPLKCVFMQDGMHGGTHDCCSLGHCGHSGLRKSMDGGCGTRQSMTLPSTDNRCCQRLDCSNTQGADCCTISKTHCCTVSKADCCTMPKTHCCTMSKTHCCQRGTSRDGSRMDRGDMTTKSTGCTIVKKCSKGQCNVKIQDGEHRYNLKCKSDQCEIFKKHKKNYSHIKIKCPDCVLNIKCPDSEICQVIDCDEDDTCKTKSKEKSKKKQHKKHGSAHHGDHHGKHHPHCSNREEHHPKCKGKIDEMEKTNESCCAKTLEKECPKTKKDCCIMKEDQPTHTTATIQTKKEGITPSQ